MTRYDWKNIWIFLIYPCIIKESRWKHFMENDKELKQAKKRTEKIYITDIAIQKVPYIRYKNFSEKQNMIMRQLARDVLS